MSQLERAEEAERDSRRGRAAAKKARKSGILGRLNHTEGKKAKRAVGWAEVDDALIAWLVRTVTGEGALVSFGTTRDGGALALTIMDGGEKHTEYFGAEEDMTAAVYSFAVTLSTADGEQIPD